ncbi:MAG: alpha/beta hydrolase [Candidatus Bathyarchaeota archaeon]|nr:alpha/beta hydrolase [Candidatus Bathyarchaeota archaeon]
MIPRTVFVHGAGGSQKVWVNQVEYFKSSLAINLPGHDGGEGKRSINEYVSYVKHFLDERSLKEVILVGHSMGGAIAQMFALKHPSYLKALVLVCTGARLRVLPEIFKLIRENYNEAVELIVNMAFSKNTSQAIKNQVVEEMLKVKPEVFYGDFEACDKFDIMDQVANIKVKTLIVCGSEDMLTPVKYSRYLNEKIANSILRIIEDSGHMVMLEKPKEFNRILEEFLNSL